MGRSMIHANGHILCAVDVETTGLNPKVHEIIQVCCLPLDSKMEPLRGIVPFYTELKPRYPVNVDYKAMSVSRLDYLDICVKGLDPDRAIDLFEEWYNRLPLPTNKTLIPLGHNWIFDHAFMTGWLGWEAMAHYFHGHYRDAMVAALYENDRSDHQVEQIPYPKLGLGYIASQLKIENPRAHDSLYDCLTTAAVYKRMLGQHIPPQLIDVNGNPLMSRSETPGFPIVTMEAP